MIDIFLTLLALSGYVYLANQHLKIAPVFCPVFCISAIIIIQYFFALFNVLQTGTAGLIFFGMVLCVFWIPLGLKKYRERSTGTVLSVLGPFAALAVVSYLLPVRMIFTVIDDYVYWGIMGKYLYLNNHLPAAGNPLDPRILAYTPGVSLFHYLVYLLTGKYSAHLSYFAQNLMLASAMFVAVRKETMRLSVIMLSALILLGTLFFGSIFTKLQVDYLLSFYLFSIFWIYASEKRDPIRLLTVLPLICCLFLIKEIGFVLGIMVLIFILVDLALQKDIGWQGKIKLLTVPALAAVLLILMKQMWVNHVDQMGFAKFHSQINMDSIKALVTSFGDPAVQNGSFIFLKKVFLGSADRLNIPYLFWYALLVVFWYIIVFKKETGDRTRPFAFSSLVLVFCLVYQFMLYCMQMIIFNIAERGHTVGFTRYYNIVFMPVILIAATLFLRQHFSKRKIISNRVVACTAAVVLIVLVASRVEVGLKADDESQNILTIAATIENTIKEKTYSLGIVSSRTDSLANLQFLYHLLPAKVDYHSSRLTTDQSFRQYVNSYDYILVYQADERLAGRVQACTNDRAKAGATGIYKVEKKTGKDLLDHYPGLIPLL